jgi:hypothetical protein
MQETIKADDLTQKMKAASASRAEAAITAQVTRGYTAIGDFTSALTQYGYAPQFIPNMAGAESLNVETTLLEAQLKEVEANYTEGYTDQKTYASAIAQIFSNSAIASEVMAYANLTETIKGASASRIEAAIASQVTRGFATIKDFSAALTEYGYAPQFIPSMSDAEQMNVETALNEAQLKEADEAYANAIWDLPTYTKAVNAVIVDPDYAQTHIDTVGIAKQRTDMNRLRTAGDLAVSYELAAYAQGAVTVDEFSTIATAMGKTPDEIARLETARNILLANKIRGVTFKTLQYLLAKRQITRSQFVAHSGKLEIDEDLIQSTADEVIAQALTKAKTTPATANEAVFASYPSVP